MHTSEESPAVPNLARRRVCLFGGSFDPVHNGHMAMARAAHSDCRLERVVFLPARRSPHKPDLQPAPAADRLAMLERAVGELGWAEVSDWELQRRGPSYSWQAAEHFSSAFGAEVELCWLLGADQWRAIETWARPEVLAARLSFIVFPRGQGSLTPKPGFRHEVIALRHPASATAVRQAVQRGQSLAGLVPPKVEAYIREHGLYK
jgi:nicotinate-nucleotide adenylyltransferase